MIDIIERTCELKPDIMVYVGSLATHITHYNITDKIAIEGLKKGYLKESQFIKFPVIKEEKEVMINNPAILENITELTDLKKTIKPIKKAK